MEDTDKQPEEILNCIHCHKPMKCTKKYSRGSDYECEICGTWRRKLINYNGERE